MSVHGQLRVLADRLEAAEAERVACMDMLAAFMQGWQTDGRSVEPWDDDPDSAAVLVAAEDQPGQEASVVPPSAPAPPIEQATSEERARGRMNVTDVLPARSPASPEPGQVPSEQPPAATGGTPVPAFDPLGPRGTTRTCPKCKKEWPSRGFMTHVRWCGAK